MGKTEMFSWTLKPGQETFIDITSKIPLNDGTFTFERNSLTIEPEGMVKISILQGPLSEVTIGKATHAQSSLPEPEPGRPASSQ